MNRSLGSKREIGLNGVRELLHRQVPGTGDLVIESLMNKKIGTLLRMEHYQDSLAQIESFLDTIKKGNGISLIRALANPHVYPKSIRIFLGSLRNNHRRLVSKLLRNKKTGSKKRKRQVKLLGRWLNGGMSEFYREENRIHDEIARNCAALERTRGKYGNGIEI